MEQGDYVWYNDFVYTVQNVSGDRALIREVNYTVTLRDLDTWVPMSQLERLTDEDMEEYLG